MSVAERLIARRLKGAQARMSSTHASTARSSSASGATSLTRPAARASAGPDAPSGEEETHRERPRQPAGKGNHGVEG